MIPPPTILPILLSLLSLPSHNVLVQGFASPNVPTIPDTTNIYDEATLHRLAQASSLSYLSMDKMPSSPYYSTCDMVPVCQVVDPITESGATIFRERRDSPDARTGRNARTAKTQGYSNDRIVVACRGSANLKNFATNLRFRMVPPDRFFQQPQMSQALQTSQIPQTSQMSQIPQMPVDALIHEGFQEASYHLWKKLENPLMELILGSDNDDMDDNGGTEKEVVFTGHSLGAANALLCSVHYNTLNDQSSSQLQSQSTQQSTPQSPPPSIITFGGPKLLNDPLAQHLRTNLLNDCHILHLVHGKDPILKNNQRLWEEMGFVNVGREVVCDPFRPLVPEMTSMSSMSPSMPSMGGGSVDVGAGSLVDGGGNGGSKSLLDDVAWNILDHCSYMGVFVGPRLF